MKRAMEEILTRVTRVEGGCWTWTAGLDRNGYARARFNNKCEFVHRVAFELVNGDIPLGMTIDHTCFIPACVNPAHLRLLSNAENASNQRTALATHCVNGHAFDEANTGPRTDGRRRCRACAVAASRRYREKRAG